MSFRKIIVPAGIGDSIWLLQKLMHAGEKFDFVLPGGNPRRGHQIFDLLPQVANSATYDDGVVYEGKKLTTKKIRSENIILQPNRQTWDSIIEPQFCLSANEWLEAGKRIEGFLPDLPTSYKLPWQTTDDDVKKSVELIGTTADSSLIGLYGSSYSTSRAWGFWDENKWAELADRIIAIKPDAVFVVIGADWDLDLGTNLIKLLEERKYPYVKVIGETLGTVVEIMKRLKYFFSFPSGLGILAATLEAPVTMFYPPHLSLMMDAWADPVLIANGHYKGCQFCEPEQIMEWVIENGFL